MVQNPFSAKILSDAPPSKLAARATAKLALARSTLAMSQAAPSPDWETTLEAAIPAIVVM
jgi:hypothetical protein